MMPEDGDSAREDNYNYDDGLDDQLRQPAARKPAQPANAPPPVTQADIRRFRVSPEARSFPGLRDMSDEDVAVIIAETRAAAQKREKKSAARSTGSGSPKSPHSPLSWRSGSPTKSQADSVKNKQQLAESLKRVTLDTKLSKPAKGAAEESVRIGCTVVLGRQPFSPASPSKSRAEVERKSPFLNVSTPYDAADRALSQQKAQDREKRASLHGEKSDFSVKAASTAKALMANKAYLNALDSEPQHAGYVNMHLSMRNINMLKDAATQGNDTGSDMS